MTITSEQENCSHHWVIDTPKGPISTGHCKICAMTKEFMNSIGEANWDKSPQSKTEPPPSSENVDKTTTERTKKKNAEKPEENEQIK